MAQRAYKRRGARNPSTPPETIDRNGDCVYNSTRETLNYFLKWKGPKMETRTAIALSFFLLVGAAAEGADLFSARPPVSLCAVPAENTERELKWDNGTLGYALIQFAADSWVGNDFDCSTLVAHNVKLIRIRSSGEWPNGRWDGFNIGIYDFRNGVPGTRIWGPTYVKGTGRGYPWCDFGVNWALPKGILKFVAAMAQWYGYPNGDPYCLDTGPAQRRGWTYYMGVWQPLQSDSNLMLRVVMQGDIGVAPTSIGRVKGLYY